MRFLVLICAAAALAHADPAAEKLFQEGRAKLAAGDLPAACDAFRGSAALEPRVGTFLNLGDCEEKRGRLATAWGAFVDARTLAKQTSDARVAEAEKRAAALEPRLAYVQIKVAERADGLVIKRDGVALKPEVWDHEVVSDAGTFAYDATAPGRIAWHGELAVGDGQHATLDVPALAIDKTAPPPGPVAPPEVVLPPLLPRHVGIGVLVGTDSDRDAIVGGRALVHLASFGRRGAVRAVPQLLFTRFDDPMDPYHHFHLYAVGLAGEYVATLSKELALAAGLGIGMDLVTDNYGNPLNTNGWGSLRVSPTYRIWQIDVGLHLQAVVTSQRTVLVGELGVDYFAW